MNLVVQVIRVICLIILAGVVLHYLYLGGLLLFFILKWFVFEPLEERFHKLITPKVKLSPGDMVLIVQDGLFHEDWDHDELLVEAIKGSTAVVLSLTEYYDDLTIQIGQPTRIDHANWVKEGVDQHERYPIRFVTVAPTDYIKSDTVYIQCKVGYVTVLPVEYMQPVL